MTKPLLLGGKGAGRKPGRQQCSASALPPLRAVCTQREGRGAQQATAAAAAGVQRLAALAWYIASCLAPFMGQSHAAPPRAAAATAVMGAARLDPDAVWMLLYDVIAGASGGGKVWTVPCESGGIGGAAGGVGLDLGSQLHLPAWRPIRASGSGGGSTGCGRGCWPLAAHMCADYRFMASQLLPAVEALAPAWHALAPVVGRLGPDWQVPASQSAGT